MSRNSFNIRHQLHAAGQSGQVPLVMVLLVGLLISGIATGLYMKADHNVSRMKALQASDTSQTASFSAVSSAKLLLQLPYVAPPGRLASNEAYVPFIYPDPYFTGNVQTIRSAAAATNPWSAAGANRFNFVIPDARRLNDTMMNAVFGRSHVLPTFNTANSLQSRVVFLGAVRGDARMPTLITHFRTSVETDVPDPRNASRMTKKTMEVEVDVPPPPSPVYRFTTTRTTPVSLRARETVPYTMQTKGVVRTAAVNLDGTGVTFVRMQTVPTAATSVRSSLRGGDVSWQQTVVTPVRDMARSTGASYTLFRPVAQVVGPTEQFGTDYGSTDVRVWKEPACTVSANPTNVEVGRCATVTVSPPAGTDRGFVDSFRFGSQTNTTGRFQWCPTALGTFTLSAFVDGPGRTSAGLVACSNNGATTVTATPPALAVTQVNVWSGGLDGTMDICLTHATGDIEIFPSGTLRWFAVRLPIQVRTYSAGVRTTTVASAGRTRLPGDWRFVRSARPEITRWRRQSGGNPPVVNAPSAYSNAARTCRFFDDGPGGRPGWVEVDQNMFVDKGF